MIQRMPLNNRTVAMDITDWRKKIDEIDRRLVELLNERARCATEIGRIKLLNGKPVQEISREEEVLRNVVELNRGPLGENALREIFKKIVEEVRQMQQKLIQSEQDSLQPLPTNRDSKK